MPKLGSGARFASLEHKIAERGDVRDPGAVAAAIGRKKFGKRRFQKLAAKGERPRLKHYIGA
jgi:hypothetical protein